MKSSLRHFNSTKPLIILDIGTNPMGAPILAEKMVRAAAQTGAAVKFQAYRVSELLHPSHPTYSELLLEETPPALLSEMIDLALSLGALCGITVFSQAGIELAVEKKVHFIKIASGDLTYHDLIERASKTGLPLILSTGCACQREVDCALKVAHNAGANLFAVLHCISIYPAPPEASNLAILEGWLKKESWLKRGINIGFSDHSLGISASLAALALGARAIEKHFTIDRNLPGGDNSISITESEAKELLKAANSPKGEKISQESIKKTPLWGKIPKRIIDGEDPLAIRRYLVAKGPLSLGAKITKDDFLYLRVGPSKLGPHPIGADEDIIGMILNRKLDTLEILQKSHLDRP